MLRNAVSMGGSLRGPSLVRGITFIAGSTGEDLSQLIEAQTAARKWLASYNSTTIPRKTCEVKFSRSSGPGGQKVNKTSSKATLRVPLDEFSDSVPSLIYEQLLLSRYYAKNSHALVIQSETSRVQSENQEECFKRLEAEIKAAGQKAVRGETSAAQKQKVENLQKAQNEVRLKSKKMHSGKKSSRRSSTSSNY